jgi:hypothetical protein
MRNARWFVAVVLLALTLTGAHVATAQSVKAEDLIGVWEVVSAKDLKTGDAMPVFSMRIPPSNGYSLRAPIGRYSLCSAVGVW